MKVPWTWLKDYVDLPWSPKETADRLTMVGVNVENLYYDKLDISSVVSGKILDVRPYPMKSTLKVGIVDVGTEKVQIISTAPGFQAGTVTLLIRPGGHLPGGTMIEERDFDGVVSYGMVLSANELLTGQTNRPSEDIISLPPETPSGLSAKDIFCLDDWVMDLDLTVNYSHCLGILGVAIEAAALAGTRLKLPPTLEKWDWAGPYGSRCTENFLHSDVGFGIRLENPDLCPRYIGKVVEDVKHSYSPVNMERRLYLAGQRPLNLVVDVTNYVMMETGQPLHAFDADKLKGNTIIVRTSMPGEKIVTLDGEERHLPDDSLVIADESGAIAVAGVLGGKSTEITDDTRRVFIESAYFDPVSVRRTSRNLRVRTEAALRFEKGVDPTGQPAVAERAADLILSLSGGRPVKGYVEENYSDPRPKKIALSVEDIKRTLGVEISAKECSRFLEGVHFKVEEPEGQPSANTATFIEVTVPPRRVDIYEEIDLIEEVARYYGYDKLGTEDLRRATLGDLGEPFSCRNRVGHLLVSLGGFESTTNSLLDPDDLLNLGWEAEDPRGKPVRIKNPLSSQESVLRTSILPGLVKVARTNQRSRIPGMFTWEIGTIFFPSESELPIEAEQLGLLSFGEIVPQTWVSQGETSGFYQMKGIVSRLFDVLGVDQVKYLPVAGMPFHPGRSGKIVANMSTIGEIGEIHPLCQRNFDLDLPVTMAWISMDALRTMVKSRKYEPISKFMPIERDIAVVVSRDVPGGEIIDAIWDTGCNLTSVVLFDIWDKPPVPEGYKSLAIRLVYQPKEQTLTEEELARDRENIISRLHQEFGAYLRG